MGLLKENKIKKTNSRNGRDILTNKYRSTTHYLLSSLVPYTEANIKLAFKPSLFFNDLDRLSRHKISSSAIRTCYYRALNDQLIEIDSENTPRITPKGEKRLRRYEPMKLKGQASILVIFDIPESERHKRYLLRTTLRELRFVKIQQSVWQSEFDIIEFLMPEIRHLHLQDYVQVYESARIK